jgi:type II secretory pathway predicted ATPase ExeA
MNILESFSMRLPTRVYLESLKVEEIAGYLRHRMKNAGCAQEVFSEGAVLAIREASGRILRNVVVLAQCCLEIAARGKGGLVDGSIVMAAVRECTEKLR